MKRAGKAHPIVIVGVLSILAYIALVFGAGGGTSTEAAVQFMGALGQGDVDTLTRLTYAPGKPEEKVRTEWEYTVDTVGPHYRFMFQLLTTKQATETFHTVAIHVFRDADNPSTYGEKFELPLIKSDKGWQVDIASVNRQMYPGLPRL